MHTLHVVYEVQKSVFTRVSAKCQFSLIFYNLPPLVSGTVTRSYRECDMGQWSIHVKGTAVIMLRGDKYQNRRGESQPPWTICRLRWDFHFQIGDESHGYTLCKFGSCVSHLSIVHHVYPLI